MDAAPRGIAEHSPALWERLWQAFQNDVNLPRGMLAAWVGQNILAM